MITLFIPVCCCVNNVIMFLRQVRLYIKLLYLRSCGLHFLYIAHDIPAAGHLAVAKTKTRLQRHFYWPCISNDVKKFCRACDVCQRLGKSTLPSVAPLYSLPVVSEPFCQIAIDIIGPLPQCKDLSLIHI